MFDIKSLFKPNIDHPNEIGWFFFVHMKESKLTLKSGETFYGLSPEWQRKISYGEVVFTTGMTGYVETLTDPSYADQIVVFTYPLIGNYGVASDKTWESSKIHAAGVIVSDLAPFYSHSKAEKSLLSWLEEQDVPIITGIDTRTLTLKIRKQGVVPAAISDTLETPKEFIDPNALDLVAKVSTKEIKNYGNGSYKIIAVDCGIKENIIRCLLNFDVSIKVVPFDYDYTKEDYDGLFLSNGPGDPANCISTIRILRNALTSNKPIFGICLGAQLLSLAIGAKTYKLPFGHRAQNQPVIHFNTNKCYLTTQNHGFAVDSTTLPKDWRVSFKHLNDDSVQGIEHKEKPFFAVQFHPEANPGPVDTYWLFERFIKMMEDGKRK